MGTFDDNRSIKRNGNSYRNIRISMVPPNDDRGFIVCRGAELADKLLLPGISGAAPCDDQSFAGRRSTRRLTVSARQHRFTLLVERRIGASL